MNFKFFVMAAWLAVAALSLSACGDKVTAPVSQSLASKVVSVDTGTYKPEESLEVARAGEALKAASFVCKDTAASLADKAAKTRELLKEKSISVSIVEVLEAVPQMLGAGKIEDVDGCSKLMAMYAGARVGGQNHMAATNGVRGILKIVAQ